MSDQAERASPAARASTTASLALVVSVTAVCGAAVLSHADPVAGPPFWKWGFWRLPLLRTAALLALPMMTLAAVELARRRRELPAWVTLTVTSTAAFGLMLLVLGAPYRPFHLQKVRYIVEDPGATSYFSAAMQTLETDDLLDDYPRHLREMRLHARTKPPGPVLYYRGMLRLFGPVEASFPAGLLLGLIAATAIPATYAFCRAAGSTADEALCGAALFSLGPGYLLFFPSFDACYPLATCAIVGLWAVGLRRDRLWASAASGLALAAALFVAYNPLVLGAAMALYAAYTLWTGRAFGRVVRHAAVLSAAVVATYAALGLATGFDPVATFRAALQNQHDLGVHLTRPYPLTVPWDLADYALGAGWLAIALATTALVRTIRTDGGERRFWAIVAFAQPAIVALSGLLATETARVWIFLTPLLAVPAGRELARLSPRGRLLVYALAWALLVLIRQNMYFVTAGPRPF